MQLKMISCQQIECQVLLKDQKHIMVSKVGKHILETVSICGGAVAVLADGTISDQLIL